MKAKSVACIECFFCTNPSVLIFFTVVEYTLEVQDSQSRSEWIRAIGIISKLGSFEETEKVYKGEV